MNPLDQLTELEEVFLDKLMDNPFVDLSDFDGTGITENNINDIAKSISQKLGIDIQFNNQSDQ